MPFEWRTDPDTGNQVQVWVAGPQQGMGSLPPQGMGSLASFEAATKPATTHQGGGDRYTYQPPDPFAATGYRWNPETDIVNRIQPDINIGQGAVNALTGLMDAPGDSTMDWAQMMADLRRAMTGGPMAQMPGGQLEYGDMLPIMQPMMRGLEQDQMRQRDQLNQALITRGMGNSTIADQARQQQATKQAADKAALVANTYSQLIPTQTNALMSLQAGERAQRAQDVAELLSGISAQEQVRQGAWGRGLVGRQQGASETAQGFAQQLQREQQDMANYFQFYNAQQQMDQVQRAQQMQSLALMLNALGQQTITPQYPTGQIQPPAPGAGSAIGGLLGNIGTAIAGTDRFGSWLFGDGQQQG